jgi:hypothetical protein
MTIRIPTALSRRHTDLSLERRQLEVRSRDIEFELKALEYSLRVVNPNWRPQKRFRARPAKRRFQKGVIGKSCLQILSRGEAIDSTELARLVAECCGAKFAGKSDRLTFASAVTLAVRRYQRRGLVEELGRRAINEPILWRIRRVDGRLTATDNRKNPPR